MNTHILSDVEMVCHRVAIIVQGKIRFVGATEEFLASEEQSKADVVLKNCSPELINVIEERQGTQVQGQGDVVEMRIGEKDVADVLRMAMDSGADVVSVTPKRVSLESIFLTAVNEEKAEAEKARSTTKETR